MTPSEELLILLITSRYLLSYISIVIYLITICKLESQGQVSQWTHIKRSIFSTRMPYYGRLVSLSLPIVVAILLPDIAVSTTAYCGMLIARGD